MELPSVNYIDKTKMATCKKADWSLKLLYLSYYSTQKGDVSGFMVQIDVLDSVKLPFAIF